MRYLISGQVDALGFDVVQANDGADALAHLRAADPLPIAILTDLSMPRLDGWRFVETVRRDDRLSTIPILVISASPQPPAGVHCLGKPVGRERLMRALAEMGLLLPAAA